MKSYNQFMTELWAAKFIAPMIKKAAQNKAVVKAVRSALKGVQRTPNAPRTIQRTRLYHGTNARASKAIDKDGYNTVATFTTPDRSGARYYANRRAQRNADRPVVRQLEIPTKTYNTQYDGKNLMQTTVGKNTKLRVRAIPDHQATKYDVTKQMRGKIKPTKDDLRFRF